MKKLKFNFKVDWKSKLIDLIIVIIGISIAFKLNNWNDSIKTEQEAKGYIENFFEENKANTKSLEAAIRFSRTNKNDIDTLKHLLLTGNYADERIKSLIASMMSLSDFAPSTSTMEDITASGKFGMIKDIELRKSIIDTYNAYQTTAKLENIISDYVNDYVTPYFFDHVRFSDFTPIHSDFTRDPIFENIVLGYDVLFSQLVSGYQRNMEKQKQLDAQLTSAIQ